MLDTAQIVFSIFLGIIALIITLFAIFVLSTSVWGSSRRWQLRRSSRR